MNDKEFNNKKIRVKKIFEKWIKHLGLSWYKIDLVWKMGDGEDKGEGFVKCMEVRSRWMYRTASINIWIEELPEDEYDLEKAIVHELVHIFVEPMRDPQVGCTDNEEYVTESLARAFLWVKEAGKEQK